MIASVACTLARRRIWSPFQPEALVKLAKEVTAPGFHVAPQMVAQPSKKA